MDLDKKEFILELFEILEDVVQNHFPERLNKLFVVNINLQSITQAV